VARAGCEVRVARGCAVRDGVWGWGGVVAAAGVALGVVGCERKSGATGSSAAAAEAEPAPDPKMVAEGEKLHVMRGCITCHSVDGSRGMGPTIAGVYGKVQTMADGRQVKADAAYLRRSIIDPQADVVPGYPAQMLNYKDVLSEKEIAALVAYIKSLKDVKGEEEEH
jgi:cytochrome c oxidase subunit II